MTRVGGVLVAGCLTAVMIVTACGDHRLPALSRAAVTFGVAEPPAPPSRTTIFLLDVSKQSPTTIESFTQALDPVLADTAQRSSPSCIDLWVMGSTEAEAQRLGSACVGPRETGLKAQRKAEALFIAAARAQLVGLAGPPFANPPRRSPIAATISRATMTHAATDEHVLIVFTDGREESDIESLECGTLPSVDAFHAALDRARVLGAESLRGFDVHFATMGFSDAKRAGCATSFRRELELQALWRAALMRASAKSIHFHAGIPEIAAAEVSG